MLFGRIVGWISGNIIINFAIVEWIEAVNEEEDILIQQAEGTVFIDELDVHLHPEWQIIIRNMLDKVFPRLQFVITTHSPHLIASAQAGEIIKFRAEKTKLISKRIVSHILVGVQMKY